MGQAGAVGHIAPLGRLQLVNDERGAVADVDRVLDGAAVGLVLLLGAVGPGRAGRGSVAIEPEPQRRLGAAVVDWNTPVRYLSRPAFTFVATSLEGLGLQTTYTYTGLGHLHNPCQGF